MGCPKTPQYWVRTEPENWEIIKQRPFKESLQAANKVHGNSMRMRCLKHLENTPYRA